MKEGCWTGGILEAEGELIELPAMNVCYLLRNRKNDPEGGSEAGVSATATTGPEGTRLRSRPMSFSVPRGEDNSPIPVGEAAVGAEGAGPPPQ